MEKVILRATSFWGRSSVIVLDGGYGIAMVSMLHESPETALIHDIIVHEEMRGKGIGDRLLAESCEEAGRLGAGVAKLSVEPGSWMADWYRRHGFMMTDVTDFDSHPCLVMERDIRREAQEPHTIL